MVVNEEHDTSSSSEESQTQEESALRRVPDKDNDEESTKGMDGCSSKCAVCTRYNNLGTEMYLRSKYNLMRLFEQEVR